MDDVLSALECLKYIRLGYDRVATYRSIYDVGQSCLILIERRQPSMKCFIDEMFKVEREYFKITEAVAKQVDELAKKIEEFKGKLLKKTTQGEEKKTTSVESLNIEK